MGLFFHFVMVAGRSEVGLFLSFSIGDGAI